MNPRRRLTVLRPAAMTDGIIGPFFGVMSLASSRSVGEYGDRGMGPGSSSDREPAKESEGVTPAIRTTAIRENCRPSRLQVGGRVGNAGAGPCPRLS